MKPQVTKDAPPQYSRPPVEFLGNTTIGVAFFYKGIASICPSTAGFTAKVCGTSNLAPWGTACGTLGGPCGHLTADYFMYLMVFLGKSQSNLVGGLEHVFQSIGNNT